MVQRMSTIIKIPVRSERSEKCGEDDARGGRTLRKSSGLVILVSSEEEQSSEADLLDVQSDKDVSERLGVESTTSLLMSRYVEHVEEEHLRTNVSGGEKKPNEETDLVHEPEQSESEKSKRGDDRSNDRVGDSCNGQRQSRCMRRGKRESGPMTVKRVMLGKRVPNWTPPIVYLMPKTARGVDPSKLSLT